MGLTKKNEILSEDDAISKDSSAFSVLSKPQSWLIKISFSLCGILLALLLFEIGFRILNVTIPQQQMWSDRPTAYYLPANSTDNRDFNYPPSKPSGVFRIIVIGDSFTQGGAVQFDDTFPKRLERMLNLNAAKEHIEVLNWGVGGFSTTQEIRLVKRALDSYQPDLILLQITLNDPELAPYRVTNPYQNSKGQVVLNNPILKYWKSLGFLVHRWLSSETRTSFKKYYFDLFENAATWNRFSDSLKQIERMTRLGHVPLVAVVFPLFTHPFDRQYPFKPLHKKIAEALKLYSVPRIDLLKSYQGIPQERLQVSPPIDSHPNEIAYRIATDVIYHSLVKLNLIPRQFRVKKLLRKKHLFHSIPVA